MNWIRVAVDMKNDPSIGRMADACDLSLATTVGCVVNVLCEMAGKAKDGDVSAVPDRTLEYWAQFDGKRGRFAEAFRRELCREDGVVRSWEKHNGAAIRKAEHDIEKKRTAREEAKNGARTARGRRAEIGVDGDGDVKAGNYQLVEVGTSSAPAEALAMVDPQAHGALHALFAQVSNASVWTGILRGFASGQSMDGNRPCDAARLGIAVQDFVASGKHLEPGGPSPNLFRGFVKRARTPERRNAEIRTAVEMEVEELLSIRRKNDRRASVGQPLLPEPPNAKTLDAMFPDGRTYPSGVAA